MNRTSEAGGDEIEVAQRSLASSRRDLLGEPVRLTTDRRGAPIIGFASTEGAEKDLDETIVVPALGELEPLVTNANLELFTCLVGRSNALSIHKPPTLAKRVTTASSSRLGTTNSNRRERVVALG